MGYQAFTNDSLTMMYEGVRGALPADEALKAGGEQPRFRVWETADWKKHAADLEREMFGRGMLLKLSTGPKIKHRCPSVIEVRVWPSRRILRKVSRINTLALSGAGSSFSKTEMPSLLALHAADRAIGGLFVSSSVQRHSDGKAAWGIFSNDLDAALSFRIPATDEQLLGTLFEAPPSSVQSFLDSPYRH